MNDLDWKLEELGTRASELELVAADPLASVDVKFYAGKMAASFRKAQYDLLIGSGPSVALVKCAADNCLNMVAGAQFCARCEAAHGKPYPFTEVLRESFVSRILNWLQRRPQL